MTLPPAGNIVVVYILFGDPANTALGPVIVQVGIEFTVTVADPVTCLEQSGAG